jgi:hypothetical protein
MSPSVCHQLVESKSLQLRTRDCIGILAHDFASTLSRHFAQVEQLCFKMPVSSRNATIKRSFFLLIHDLPRLLRPFLIPGSFSRTRLMSRSVHRRMLTPPILCSFGAVIFFAAMYRCRLIRLMPSFRAASRVEILFILTYTYIRCERAGQVSCQVAPLGLVL